MSLPISARFLNLHADHCLVVGTDQLGVKLASGGDLQVVGGQGIGMKTTLTQAYTFTGTVPSCGIAPTSGNHLTNKTYVDGLVNGLSWKDAVRVHASNPITLSGGQTIDGVSVNNNDRVLVSAQSTASQDGIYVVNTGGAWSRSTDCQIGESIDGIAVWVQEGTSHGNKVYSANNTGVVNTDGWTVVEIGGGTAYSAGDGLALASTTFSVDAADTSLTVAPAGVSVNAPAQSGLTISSGLRVDINGTTAETVADNADKILIWDNSASALKSMTRANFLSGLASGSTRFAAYTITGGNITAKNATITGVAGNVGSNHIVFWNGVMLETTDAVLTPGTGVLDWNGLTLDGRAAAGDIVTVWGHN